MPIDGLEAKKRLRNRGPKRPDRASFGLRDGTTAQSGDGCDSLSLSSNGVSTSGSDLSRGALVPSTKETPMSASAVATSQWLTLAQAAEILGVCTRTIRRRISAGELPAYKIGRKAIRIKIADLDRISQRIPAARM